MTGGHGLPAVLRAERAGAELSTWIAENRDEVDRLAHRAGAVLFRGFAVGSAADFRRAMEALSDTILDYGERSSPRSEVSTGVYCDSPPISGGRTPLADSRRVLAGLGGETVRRFEKLGVRYVRNYLPGIGLPWQEAFQTGSPAEVEAYCAAEGIAAEWVDEDHLRTTQVRPAVREHPVTGERTWFNHAVFFHITSLPAEVSRGLLDALPEEDLPNHTYYGDGSPIEPETLAELRAVQQSGTTGFDWKRGDVLLVENMITAHGREPFEGPRRILTAMADPARGTGRTA